MTGRRLLSSSLRVNRVRARGTMRHPRREGERMTFKQRVLSVLSKAELLELGKRFELDVKTSMTLEELVKRLGGSKRAALDKLLLAFTKKQLDDACNSVGLPGGGTKAELMERILGARPGNGNGATAGEDAADEDEEAAAQDGAAAYEHKDAKALARPDVGTQPEFKKKRDAKKYRYDSSLSPALEWDGSSAREQGEALIRRVLEAATIEEAKAAAAEMKGISKPFLDWAGKAERLSFEVPTLPLFVHERLSTKAILETLKGHKRDKQTTLDLFGDPERPIVDQVLKAYEYQDRWVNRMILGDSLVVMNSLLHYEGLGGQVQMVYVDPPYGVKFGSNFQPFVRRRDVSHNDDADMTREPEMVQAYRDTWELGLHSYLTYMRDRLLLARDLLAPTGSIFVQISDENVHHVSELLDEVFGAGNRMPTVVFRKTTGAGSPTGYVEGLPQTYDYLLWYCRDASVVKFNRLYLKRSLPDDDNFRWVENADGCRRRLGKDEDINGVLPTDRIFRPNPITAQTGGPTTQFPVYLDGRAEPYVPSKGGWKTNAEGMERLKNARRLMGIGKTLCFVRYHDDFPFVPVIDIWDDTRQSGFSDEKLYVVQTSAKVIQRCILMTTDPGDLVFDPTCGSGTTAYVAEQWGRRWITADVSRVPLALARQRLLTATYPYFELTDDARGPAAGFRYKRRKNARGEEVGGIVSHVTLKSIANDEPPAEEVLVDRPEELKGITRVTGPFAFEATIPSPVEGSSETEEVAPSGDAGAGFAERMVEVLRKSPILRLEGNREVKLKNVRPPAKTLALSAEALQVNGEDRAVAFAFGPENGAVTEKLVFEAAREANVKGYKHLYVIGFAIQPNARQTVEKAEAALGIAATYVQASPDLLMGDLLKNMRSSQIFSVCGLPDATVKKGPQKGTFVVELNGVDVFDPVTMKSESRRGGDVPCWLLDTDYNGLSFHVSQAFFPRTGAWDALKKALRAEYDEAVFDHLAGAESAPFEAGEHRQVAVKVIDDRGNELLIVKPLR